MEHLSSIFTMKYVIEHFTEFYISLLLPLLLLLFLLMHVTNPFSAVNRLHSSVISSTAIKEYY